MLTRRYLLRGGVVLAAGLGAAPRWLVRATAQGSTKRKILVVVFQRGAADGLNIVVPFAEPEYYKLRPTIAVAPPGKSEGAIDLDGRFAFHPLLSPFKLLWDNRQLAIVEATGSPDPTRSHFDAQDFMEAGTPGKKIVNGGWLARAVKPIPAPSPLRVVSMGPRLPRTLRGSQVAVAVSDIDEFKVGNRADAGSLQHMYTTDRQLSGVGKETFEALKLIGAISRQPYTPAKGTAYRGQFGHDLQQIARLIKADVGVEVAFADMGGWDHHVDEVPRMESTLPEFGWSLASFVRDLGDRIDDVVIVTMSEFGRTLSEGSNNGTDHGHGNVMFVMGGAVNGGKIYGKWPGLQPEQLYEQRDLAVTTDYRDVLCELVRGHMGQAKIDHIFPEFTQGPTLGLLKS